MFLFGGIITIGFGFRVGDFITVLDKANKLCERFIDIPS